MIRPPRCRAYPIDWSYVPLGKRTDAAIAAELGVRPAVVAYNRRKLGISPSRMEYRRPTLSLYDCGLRELILTKLSRRQPVTLKRLMQDLHNDFGSVHENTVRKALRLLAAEGEVLYVQEGQAKSWGYLRPRRKIMQSGVHEGGPGNGETQEEAWRRVVPVRDREAVHARHQEGALPQAPPQASSAEGLAHGPPSSQVPFRRREVRAPEGSMPEEQAVAEALLTRKGGEHGSSPRLQVREAQAPDQAPEVPQAPASRTPVARPTAGGRS